MSLANHDIEQLVALCRQKDPRAQTEIYRRYSRAMYNSACRIVKDEHYAEDVMQEGFLKAFLKIGDYRGEVAFGAWLKKIIVNYSIDFYKKQHRMQYDDFEKVEAKLENSTETAGSDITSLKASHVIEKIQTLKDNYRMVLTLFFIEGYDQEEIPQIMDISYANCRTLLSRAKESLRQKLLEK